MLSGDRRPGTHARRARRTCSRPRERPVVRCSEAVEHAGEHRRHLGGGRFLGLQKLSGEVLGLLLGRLQRIRSDGLHRLCDGVGWLRRDLPCGSLRRRAPVERRACGRHVCSGGCLPRGREGHRPDASAGPSLPGPASAASASVSEAADDPSRGAGSYRWSPGEAISSRALVGLSAVGCCASSDSESVAVSSSVAARSRVPGHARGLLRPNIRVKKPRRGSGAAGSSAISGSA